MCIEGDESCTNTRRQACSGLDLAASQSPSAVGLDQLLQNARVASVVPEALTNLGCTDIAAHSLNVQVSQSSSPKQRDVWDAGRFSQHRYSS